ncbi:MAG TPA: DUF167 domain-containing protein [Gemmatimonadaceae bacterium]|nr:DUF167 domain-containing protein [Gemmatimonadaceae bacterium]
MRIEPRDGGVRFAVHVQPRASRTEVAGTHGDAVKIRLQAPPVDDAANEMLVEFLSERFAVAARNVRIVAGAHSRAKTVEIDGLTADDVRRILTIAG